MKSFFKNLDISAINPLVFLPGLLLVAFGLAVVFAPWLILSFVAAFFILAGVSFCVLAFKFIQFKRKLDKFSSSFGNVHIRTYKSAGDRRGQEKEDYTVVIDSDKITYH